MEVFIDYSQKIINLISNEYGYKNVLKLYFEAIRQEYNNIPLLHRIINNNVSNFYDEFTKTTINYITIEVYTNIFYYFYYTLTQKDKSNDRLLTNLLQYANNFSLSSIKNVDEMLDILEYKKENFSSLKGDILHNRKSHYQFHLNYLRHLPNPLLSIYSAINLHKNSSIICAKLDRNVIYMLYKNIDEPLCLSLKYNSNANIIVTKYKPNTNITYNIYEYLNAVVLNMNPNTVRINDKFFENWETLYKSDNRNIRLLFEGKKYDQNENFKHIINYYYDLYPHIYTGSFFTHEYPEAKILFELSFEYLNNAIAKTNLTFNWVIYNNYLRLLKTFYIIIFDKNSIISDNPKRHIKILSTACSLIYHSKMFLNEVSDNTHELNGVFKPWKMTGSLELGPELTKCLSKMLCPFKNVYGKFHLLSMLELMGLFTDVSQIVLNYKNNLDLEIYYNSTITSYKYLRHGLYVIDDYYIHPILFDTFLNACNDGTFFVSKLDFQYRKNSLNNTNCVVYKKNNQVLIAPYTYYNARIHIIFPNQNTKNYNHILFKYLCEEGILNKLISNTIEGEQLTIGDYKFNKQIYNCYQQLFETNISILKYPYYNQDLTGMSERKFLLEQTINRNKRNNNNNDNNKTENKKIKNDK